MNWDMKIDLCTLEHRRRTIGARNSISNKKNIRLPWFFCPSYFFTLFSFCLTLFLLFFRPAFFFRPFSFFFSVRLPFFRPMFFDTVCSFFLSALFSSFFFPLPFTHHFSCMFFLPFFGFFISFFCHYFFSHIFFARGED